MISIIQGIVQLLNGIAVLIACTMGIVFMSALFMPFVLVGWNCVLENFTGHHMEVWEAFVASVGLLFASFWPKS